MNPFNRSRDREIWKAIKRLERQQMITQAEVDAITTEVQKVATDLGTVQSTLQTEINALAAANPSLDLSGPQTAVAPLGNLQPIKAEATPEP